MFRPADIHLLVARDLIAEGAWLHPATNWRELRAAAEREARSAASREEIRLADIQFRLAAVCGAATAARAIECELRHELEQTSGIHTAIARVAALLARGERVVYSSDMYLPLAQVEAMLVRAGAPAAPVFLSSELGLTKRSGALFEHIARVLEVGLAEIRHTGDHPDADHRVPRRLGLKTTLFRASAPTTFEADVHRALAPAAPLLAATLAGGMRARRLAQPAAVSAADHLLLLGTQEGGFIHLAFATWLLERLSRCEPRKIVFLARDGYLPSRLFAAMQPSLAPGLPAAAYVYASRQALHLAGLRGSFSEEDLTWIMLPAAGLTFEAWHFRLGLSREEIVGAQGGAAAELPAAQAPYVQCRPACDALLEATAFRDLVLAKADAARQLAAAYLAPGIAPESGTTAMVDIGWNGRMQRSIVDILGLSTVQRRNLQGFYLGILRTPPGDFGAYTAWLFDLRTELRPYCASHFHLYETLFAAPHPTTYEYRRPVQGGPVEPVLAPTDAMAPLWPDLIAFHDTVVAIAAGVRCEPGELAAVQPALRAFVRATVAALFRAPSNAQAKAFQGMTFSSDQTDLGKAKLVHELTWPQQYRCLLDSKFKLSPNHWREGQLALADAPGLRFGYRFGTTVRLWMRRQITLKQAARRTASRLLRRTR